MTTQISVEEIMYRIREEVRRRKAQLEQKAAPGITNPLEKKSSLEPIRFSFSLPEQRIEIKDSYHVNELLAFHDVEFVKNAYRAILRREPDHEGYEHYLTGLRSGKFSKIEILGRLRYSPEGRQKGVKIKGLLLPFGVKCLKRIPIVGYIAGTLVGIANLNTITRNMETFEAFVNTYFTKQLQREHEVLAVLESEINKTIERINHKIAPIQLLENQLLDQRNEIIRQLESELRGQREEIIGQVNESLEEIKRLLFQRVSSEQLENKLRGQKEEIIGQVNESLEEIKRKLRDHSLNIVDQQRRLTLLLEEARKRLPEPISQEQIKNMLTEEDHLLDAMYVSFEDRFRGTRADIKERLKVYLPYVKETLEKTGGGLILDVGCGRGEWLELLKENGIKAVGVDINRVMVNQCKELDLNVIEADAIEYLRKQKNNTFSVITGFHIVEHLPLKTMIALFDECLRVLKPGGMVIFETPNPENLIVGACNFYTDPSHRNPIPPETLKFLIEARGFVGVQKLESAREKVKEVSPFLDEFINQWINRSPDYAILAIKS